MSRIRKPWSALGCYGSKQTENAPAHSFDLPLWAFSYKRTFLPIRPRTGVGEWIHVSLQYQLSPNGEGWFRNKLNNCQRFDWEFHEIQMNEFRCRDSWLIRNWNDLNRVITAPMNSTTIDIFVDNDQMDVGARCIWFRAKNRQNAMEMLDRDCRRAHTHLECTHSSRYPAFYRLFLYMHAEGVGSEWHHYMNITQISANVLCTIKNRLTGWETDRQTDTYCCTSSSLKKCDTANNSFSHLVRFSPVCSLCALYFIFHPMGHMRFAQMCGITLNAWCSVFGARMIWCTLCAGSRAHFCAK